MISQLEMTAWDQLVPQDHLVRKMEAALDFSFIYDLVKDMYSEVERPSIDPVTGSGGDWKWPIKRPWAG